MNIKKSMVTNSTILITGATGFIGGLLVDELASVNSQKSLNISLILPVRNIQNARSKYSPNDDKYNCISFIETSLEDIHPDSFHMPIDYIFHCACSTLSSTMISNPVEVADGIILGTKNILEIARKKRIKSMVYLSSMEIYGTIKGDISLVTEDILGDIDIYSTRSCYPLGKRLAEHYCHIYYKEYGVPVKIARLAQTFGYGIDPEDKRVFAQFARAAYEGKDIVLHTKGLSMGNYCESRDALNALFIILNDGQDGEAYNVVNEENTMQIRDMAHLVAERIALNRIKVIYNIPQDTSYGYATDTNIKLSSEKLRKLGWKPRKNLKEMYRDVIELFQKK